MLRPVASMAPVAARAVLRQAASAAPSMATPAYAGLMANARMMNNRTAVRNLSATRAMLNAASSRRFSSGSTPESAPEEGEGAFRRFYRRHIYGTHDYEVRHEVFPPEMPAEERFRHLERNPAPGTWAHSTPEGAIRWIFPYGRIHTISDPATASVTNTPLFPHLLYPWLGGSANVRRSIDGEAIVGRGRGQNFFPSLQEAAAPYVWGGAAESLRMAVNPAYRQRQEDLVRIQGGESMPGGD